MPSHEERAYQQRAANYGVMFDAIFDYVVPEDEARLYSPDAIRSVEAATTKLKNRGLQDRQIMDLIRVTTLGAKLIREDLHKLSSGDFLSESDQEKGASLAQRAFESNRSVWEQEILETEIKERQVQASAREARLGAPSPGHIKELARRNVGSGVALIAGGALLWALNTRGNSSGR